MTNTSPIQTKRLTLILILGSLAALGPLSIDMYLPAFPDMSRSFGASASSIQLSLTACMLGMALGQIIVGPLSDVRGRKRPLLLALSAYLLASLACAFAPTIEVLIALRFVQGAAGASGIVISRAIVRDLFEGPELTKFFAALSLVNGTAPILAPIIGGQILRFGDWRIVFYLLAVLSTLMLIAVAFRLPETLPVHHRVEGNLKTTFQTFGRLLSDRTFIGYAFAQAFAMGAMFAYISGSPFVLQNIYGASPQQFSFLFGLNGIGIILAAQTAGRLAGRVDSEKMMRIALTVVAMAGICLFLALTLSDSLILVMIPLFFVVSSVGMISTLGFTLAMQNYGSTAGSASALLGLLPMLVGSLVSPLVGVMGEESALPMGLIIMTLDCLALLVYTLLIVRRTQ
ncbi:MULTISPECIES: Bcr/CflA family multidrug efflux MFS transporter [Exiguobacterium]|uniref:Bcr/CflA family efflux transporter n=1 Tax=Exiguobacterium sibiricum (strain DSM 17290 / CCUG 55495 / CIP 109462 / JCM 13490 / 255-15) TaxID=262543 RepID=B1YHT5_EXIS2|nr:MULTISPECIES: Bcr/CflA family multidrug efflux MFS transporter [Exiguobacterium]ACB59719.1 drug resistance transporter, Bcr/CflA subfamily [Exiguobacterium sibiricum 255-15]MCT4792079.1 Bcr/CflA family multidrug efflux MFS transporter [Exiguobacterium artemiae]